MSALDKEITIKLTVCELIKLQTKLEYSIKDTYDMLDEDETVSRKVWEADIERERVIIQKIEKALNEEK
jgi:hypothetical protein